LTSSLPLTLASNESEANLFREIFEEVNWEQVLLECPAFGGTCPMDSAENLLRDKELSYGSPKGEHSIFSSPGGFSELS